MNKIILPMEWYIAQTKWLSEELSKLPRCLFGKHRGNIVVRVYSDKEKNKFKEISQKSKQFNEAAKFAEKRTAMLSKIRNNKLILSCHYKVNYEAIKDSYTITPNTTNFLDSNYWKNSITNTNPHTSTTAYHSNGVNYKSRYEMYFASVCSNLGIEFSYEPQVFISDYKERFADFGFYFPVFNRCTYIELLGQMANDNYTYDVKKKLSEYIDNKFYIGRDLFILSGDDNYIPGQMQLQSIIIAMITTMCELHIKKLV